MGKVINLLTMALIGMLLFCQAARGQNNPYKIDDRLYAYYQQCNRLIKSPKVMLMADTLFQRAVQKKDVKAQCLAKNLKAEHYYFTGNIDSLLIEKERVADFARGTPFKQYIFGVWNRVITYYLRKREYETAFQELKKYQDEALRLNEPYGIGQSYIRMGDAYFQQRMSELAIKEYMKAVNHYQSTGKENELYHPYYTIGACYINMKQLEEAEKYTIKSVDTAPNQAAQTNSYLGLLRIYTKSKKFDQAEKIKSILIRSKAKGIIQSSSLTNYYTIIANYYLDTSNFEQARVYSDSIADEQVKSELKSRLYARQGDYRAAYNFLKRNLQVLDSLSLKSNADMLASYNARFNNQKLELEKNRLSLQNAEMKLKQLEDREQLILMEKEQTRIELENRNLQLEKQHTAIELEKAETQKQRLEVLHKQEELQRIEMERAANQRMGIAIISLLAVITGFSTIYALTRRRHAKHLQIEKDAAEAARKEAEKADKLKSAFLQNMSHEIRTPLNAIVGFNDLLNDETMELSQEERQELMSHLHTNTDLLLTLVNDVLDLSKLESGNYKLYPSDVTLSTLCQTTLSGVSQRVQEGVRLSLQQPSAEVVITTDGQRLQQILTNLLVNACRYTRQGHITLSYEQKDDHVRFAVTDTGCGIEKDKAEVIFQRFEKLNSFNSGFGLGLSICRSLTHALGGKIYLDTEYTGGARFIVELPLYPPVSSL